MIVSSLDSEGFPARGVAVNMLGHSKQSCMSGHTSWHSASAWRHCEHTAYSVSPGGLGGLEVTRGNHGRLDFVSPFHEPTNNLHGAWELSVPPWTLESRPEKQVSGRIWGHGRPRLRNSLGGVIGGDLGGDEALPWFVPRIAHERMGVR